MPTVVLVNIFSSFSNEEQLGRFLGAYLGPLGVTCPGVKETGSQMISGIGSKLSGLEICL